MKKKLVATIIGASTVGVLSVSASAAIANHNKINALEIPTSELSMNYESTTGTAIELKDDSEVVEDIIENDILDSQIVKLNAEIKGNAVVGETLSVEIKAFNEADQEVEFDQSKLKYEWVTEEDNKILGNESELKIDESMEGSEIHCNVSYEEN